MEDIEVDIKEKVENIGERRMKKVMEKVMEEI